MIHSKKCKCCGKPFISKRNDAKYCSLKCRARASRQKQKKESIYDMNDDLLKYPKFYQEDSKLGFTDKDGLFMENDNNWGLGESNLTEKPMKDFNLEHFYIKKEMKRIFGRKPNP